MWTRILVVTVAALLLSTSTGAAEDAGAACARRKRACAPVRAEAMAFLDAEGRACTADWECGRHLPVLLGCGAWARRDVALPGPLADRLDEACGPMSLDPGCDEKIGACVAGRCAGRKRSGLGCEAARAALTARLAAPAACQRDADCRGRRFPQEEHAVRDGCWAGPGTDLVIVPQRCAEGACVASAPDEDGLEQDSIVGRGPVALDRSCLVRAVDRLTQHGALPAGRFTLKFAVSLRGRIRALSLARADRPVPLLDLAQALQDCRYSPAVDTDGRPIPVWVLQPIVVHR